VAPMAIFMLLHWLLFLPMLQRGQGGKKTTDQA